MSVTEVVLEILSSEPQTIADLARAAGLSRRDCEQALEELAHSGDYPLVADGRGVRLTDDPSELGRYQESLRRRAMAVLRRYRGIGQARAALEARSAAAMPLVMPWAQEQAA